MATIINNPSSPTDRVIERDSDTAGWAVAIIILIAVIAGLIWWFRGQRAPAPPAQSGSANINVTLPTTQGTGGSASGGTDGGTGGAQPGANY